MSASLDLVIAGGAVVMPGRVPQSLDLGIKDEIIVGHFLPGSAPEAKGTIDASGLVVLPGAVDPHVHFGFGNGSSEWESETRSAAVGGVTTAFSFLMTGADYTGLIDETLTAARERAVIDFGLHIVPSVPRHLDELEKYVGRGITSFKYFMSFRGTEGSYLGVDGTDDGFLFSYLREVARHPGAVACVHAENIEVAWMLRRNLQESNRDDLRAWGESRPPFIEAESALRAMYFAWHLGCPLYLVHVSSRAALDEVRAWRARWPNATVYVETCPHFLTHTDSAELGSLGKINPPLRTAEDVEALWDAIADGTVDTVGSDHIARRKAKKAGSIWTASAGFPGTATILPVLLSEGYHRRGIPLERIAQITSSNPARVLGCYPRKGSLQVGSDADIALVDLDAEFDASPAALSSYADYSLYEGWRLKGAPVMTISRGDVIAKNQVVTGRPGRGRYIGQQGEEASKA